VLRRHGAEPLNTHAAHSRQGGFTLLELLLAIFIFAIVTSSVYGAYRSTFLVINTTESQAEYSSMARVALDRITGDLESAYFGNGSLFEAERKEVDTGRADQLTFTSSFHLVFGKNELPAGSAMVRYSTEIDEESGLLKLYRLDMALRPGESAEGIEEKKGFLLCDRLAEVQFSYFDTEGNEVEDWKSHEGEGEEQGEFPVMTRVTLRFAESADSEERIVFSTAVAMARTTQERAQ